MTTLAIEMKGITKRFGDILANDSVDFKVKHGEIHALVGENGAGKTTLMNILYGLYRPDSGQILINGTQKDILSPADAIKNGIGMVHQHFMLVGPLSVIENIILGDEDTKFGVIDFAAAKARLGTIIEKFKLNINLNVKVETLPVGTQQKIEILKILYRNSDIIIFDEPSALLTPQEADELFILLKNLKLDGKSIILITHKLGEVLSVSDRVTVLRHGKVIGVKTTSETNRQELAEMIVGGNMPEPGRKMNQPEETKILSIKELFVEREKSEDAVMGVSFGIHSGEIFGIAGVEGNGQSELVEAINGLRDIKSGEIKIIGGKNIAHIPANRHKNGIVNEYTLTENILLGRQHEKQFSNGWQINKRHLTAYTNQLISDYDIRPGDALQQTSSLSGGNQQKLVAARELTKNSKLIIASHPTRGLDIKATEFVHNILIEQRNKEKAVLLVSADLGELLKLSDRIGVMYNGKITLIVDAAKTNERELGLYMTGASEVS